jgi:DNA repair protein RadD
VHGKQPKAERDALIAGLGNGEVEILTSCDLISEGLDVPAVACVIALRPTESLSLHRQQIGRGMRPLPGKAALIVNDHVGNCFAHGLVEFEPLWNLDGVEKPKGEAPVWQCPECGSVNSYALSCCECCGCPRPISTREPPEERSGDLVEATVTAHLLALPYRKLLAGFVRGDISEAQLRLYGQHRRYHPRWVDRCRAERAAAALGGNHA